ncbi:MAG: hypothetical protein JOZ51_23165, partial [Chloroflexi bacterium]|nr:hypothetical protein [Chloroflexota bacterium]
MHLFRSTRVYRSLIIIALGTLAITGCQQGMTSSPRPDVSSGIEVYPALGATAVVGEVLPAAVEQPTYYLYILDRDGVPVQRFECDGQLIDRESSLYCERPDGTNLVVSEAVLALMTTE